MDEELKEVPVRRDGTKRSFWYDPDCPGHIMHYADDYVEAICVGHGDHPYKAHR